MHTRRVAGSKHQARLLGASTIKADNLILVAHKASKTANVGTVYWMKTGGSVRIPLEPGDVMSLVAPGGEELTLDQFTIETCPRATALGTLQSSIHHLIKPDR